MLRTKIPGLAKEGGLGITTTNKEHEVKIKRVARCVIDEWVADVAVQFKI